MVAIPNKVKLVINQFLNELANNNIAVEQAVLFGSYAQGTSNEWSDIDLAVVSKVFVGERFADRKKIRRIKLNVSSDLDPVPYRPEDFNDNNPFVKRIIETGIKVL
jgi:predicted nucleotidyltransferase